MRWLAMLVGCAEPECKEGFQLANDGLCYPVDDEADDVGDDDDHDVTPRTTDSDTTTRPTDTGRPRTSGPRIWLDSTLVDAEWCEGGEAVLALEFLGEASRGVVDLADTANVESGTWNESHTLEPVAFTPAGTELATGLLQTGVAPSDWFDGGATVFRCEEHLDQQGVMTHIARAYDLYGELSDCAVWGHDPEGFVEGGDYVQNNPRPDEHEIHVANCRVLAVAR